MKFSVHQASHIGDRKYNQDRVAYAYSSEALLLVLADGMGGHLRGEAAADLVVGTFIESFGRDAQPRIADPGEFVPCAMRHANERILRLAYDSTLGGAPGSTCVAALVQDDKLYWGHAGDSRLYLLRDNAIRIRTRDHSRVQQLLEWGAITAEEARVHPQRNQVTNCLGVAAGGFFMERNQPVTLQSGDVLLLGSDGLWGPFTDQELAETFTASPVSVALDNLAARALERERGCSDNVTGIAMRWGEGEDMQETPEPACQILEIG